MRIYTKIGDTGQPSLYGGQRVAKDATQIQVVGEIDELNAYLGLAKSTSDNLQINEVLQRVQHELFNLGAELGTPNDLHHKLNFQIAQQQVSQLEIDIDTLENELPPIRQFILPGGTFSSSVLHLARTVCRRCERRVVALSKDQPVSRETFQYLNRLSDLLFVLARTADAEIGVADVFWTQPSPQQR